MAEASANVYRVNKLLEIEVADWQRQLDRAVSVFPLFHGSRSGFLSLSNFSTFTHPLILSPVL